MEDKDNDEENPDPTLEEMDEFDNILMNMLASQPGNMPNNSFIDKDPMVMVVNADEHALFDLGPVETHGIDPEFFPAEADLNTPPPKMRAVDFFDF